VECSHLRKTTSSPTFQQCTEPDSGSIPSPPATGIDDFDDPWLPITFGKPNTTGTLKKVRTPADRGVTDSRFHSDVHSDCIGMIHMKHSGVCNCLLKSDLGFSQNAGGEQSLLAASNYCYSGMPFSDRTNADLVKKSQNCSSGSQLQKATPTGQKVGRRGSSSSQQDDASGVTTTKTLAKTKQLAWSSIGSQDSSVSSSGGGSSLPRRASLDGLMHSFRGIRGQRISDVTDRSTHNADTSPCWSPVSSSTSTISDAGSDTHISGGFDDSPGDLAVSSSKDNWLRFPRFIARAYSGRRQQQCGKKATSELRRGASSAVDAVRRGLTHLMRPGDESCSTVVGERMALGCPSDAAGSTFTLDRSRRLNSIDDDDDLLRSNTTLETVISDAVEDCSRLFEADVSVFVTETADSHLNNGDNRADLTTFDSYYESKLFDALEARSEPDTESSDNGSYSDLSCAELVTSQQELDCMDIERMPSPDGKPSLPENNRRENARHCSVESKGTHIRDIVQSLEAAKGTGNSSICGAGESGRRPQHGDSACGRQRELASCAAIARMRRHSCSPEGAVGGSEDRVRDASNARNLSV
jgi:hypothetical protein